MYFPLRTAFATSQSFGETYFHFHLFYISSLISWLLHSFSSRMFIISTYFWSVQFFFLTVEFKFHNVVVQKCTGCDINLLVPVVPVEGWFVGHDMMICSVECPMCRWKECVGIPGWRSGLAPAFGPGRDPGDPGSNPTSGPRCMEPASPSACVSASVSLSVTIINNKKWKECVFCFRMKCSDYICWVPVVQCVKDIVPLLIFCIDDQSIAISGC